MSDTLKSILLFSILVIIGIAVFILFKIVIPSKERKYVFNNSLRLKKVFELNDRKRELFSWELKDTYHFSFRCKSKSAFDHFDEFHFFAEKIGEDLWFFQSRLGILSDNKKQYLTDYLPALEQIMKETAEISFPKRKKQSKYQQIEKDLIAENQLHPVCKFEVVVTYSYTSPQGRNHYVQEGYLTDREIQTLIEEREEKNSKKNSILRERALMTDSLRYDIMKRDHFRCVICGATQEDGVKLHVDHIIPVSKGGKTEKSNLRTLCERCNLGKSAKYDPNGLN